MRILCIAGIGLLLGGCALFDSGARTAAVRQPESASTRAASAGSFRPAYGIGHPVALVPCGRGAKLTDDCASGNTRHQLGGEGAAEREEAALSQVALVPVAE